MISNHLTMKKYDIFLSGLSLNHGDIQVTGDSRENLIRNAIPLCLWICNAHFHESSVSKHAETFKDLFTIYSAKDSNGMVLIILVLYSLKYLNRIKFYLFSRFTAKIMTEKHLGKGTRNQNTNKIDETDNQKL